MYDRLLGVIMVIFSILMYRESLKLTQKAQWDVIGPAFFPKFILAVILCLSILLIYNSFRHQDDSKIPGTKNDLSLFALVFIYGVMGAYIYLMQILGFLISSFLFLLTMQWFLSGCNNRHLGNMVLISIVSAFVVYYTFVNYLGVFLPRGIIL